ncbi:competence protein CoiA family protein [Nocardiopsis sp. NPDC006832]|uniref:competence protein CoiA family protein n=1 Tax=Nocardiopsis sp. NPDC006832 TaxID=3157188 RepID=UPI0033DB1402
MPETRFEAVRFRADHAHRSFWCGVWLGGCGKKLSTRVGKVRIPHFAHYPEFPERHVCRRRYTDSASADHLYLTRDLENWLVAQGRRTPEVDLRGDFAEGDTCRQAVLTTDRGLVSVEFSPGLQEEKGEHAWRTRLFGPRAIPPPRMVKQQRYVLRARLGTPTGRYRTEIGTMTPRGETRWTPLRDCVLTERGLTTPHMPVLKPTGERKTPSPEIFGLPLDHRDLIAYPKGEHSSGRHGIESPKHAHRLAVYFQARQQQRRAGHLWLPEPVSGLAIGAPHRITGPAWADLDRSAPERWSVRAQGLTPVDTEPPKPEPVPASSKSTPVSATPETTSPKLSPPEPEAVPVPEARPVLAVPDRIDVPGVADVGLGKGKLKHIPDELLERSSPPPEMLGWLSKNGWSGGKQAKDRGWVSFAMMDENRVRQMRGPEASHVRTLVVLRRLGERWLAACLLDSFNRDFIAIGASVLRDWSRQTEDAAIARMEEWPQIRSHAVLEKGVSLSAIEKSRAHARVALQLLGVLALLGEYRAVRSLVDDAMTRDLDSGWSKRFQSEGVREGYRVEFDDKRNSVFRITFTDANGVRGEGAHRDREVARKMAAKSYAARTDVSSLSKKIVKGVTPRSVDSPPITPRNYRRLPEEWQEGLCGVHKTLVPGGRGEGWVVQALTDASWAEQNRSLLLASGQKDNGMLAHQGSTIGHLLRTHRHSRRLLERTITPDEDEIQVGPVPAGDWRRFLVEVGADRLVLTGDGAARPKAEQTAAKALIGACWRSWPRPSDLVDTDLSAFFDVHDLMPDPVSWRRRMNTLFGLTGELKSEPAQAESSFHTTSLVLGWREHRAILQGPLVLPKTRHRILATLTERTLRIAEKVRSADPWELSETETPVAEVLIAAQLSGPREEPDKRDRDYLVRRGHLGIDHLGRGDIDTFAAWAEQVDELHGHVEEAELTRVARLYRTLLMSMKPVPTPASRRMSRRLLTLLDLTTMTSAEQKEVRTMIAALASLGRVSASFGQYASVGRLPLAKTEGAKPAPEVDFSDAGHREGPATITSRQAGALRELIARIRVDDESAEVEVAQEESGVYVVVSGVEGVDHGEVHMLADLLSEVVPTLTFEAHEDEYTVMILREDPIDSLLQAGARALRDSFRLPPRLAEALTRLEASFQTREEQGKEPDLGMWDALRRELQGVL